MNFKMIYVINLISLFLVLAFCALYYGMFADNSFAGYIDDIIPLILGVVGLYAMFKGNMSKFDMELFWWIAAICVIGIISNLANDIVSNYSYVVNDMFSFLKMFLSYWGVRALFNGKENRINNFLSGISVIAKIFIIVIFIFGLLNLLGFVEMYDEIRFGIKNYYFIMGNASQFGVITGVALALIILSGKSNIIYEIMACTVLIMTAKGMSLIILSVYVVLNLFGGRKIKLWHFLLLGIVLIFVLNYQLTNYLLDESAPRALLLRYGLKTAVDYFPLGAGFAAFGSNMAAVHYSPLYVRYGFRTNSALTTLDKNEMGTALNDAYLGMSLGQFGILGTICLFVVFTKIGQKLVKSNYENKKAHNICIACFICFCGMAIMAGSIKGSCGQLILAVLAIYFSICEKEQETQN